MFSFEYLLILSNVMFYVRFRVSFGTHYVLCLVSRYRLILDKFYLMFQCCRLGVFIIIVYKAPVSLTGVFKHCYSLSLERADFDRQSFQYTWLNSYFFIAFVMGPLGPQKQQAPSPVPRPTQLNGQGRGVLFWVSLPPPLTPHIP